MTTQPKEYRLWPKTGWGNEVNIDSFGVTGDHASGKTTMGISIAPGKHPEGHPHAGKARTLVIDLEKSSTNYLSAGFDHVDAPPMIERFARKNDPRGSGYTSLNMLDWFVEFVSSIPSVEGTFLGSPAFRYDVIMVDPINDLDDGVMNYVKGHPGEFNLSKGQSDTALIYKGVKQFWKQKLILLADKCRCFFFTTHLGTVWKDGKPTKDRKSKGSGALNEIAMLRLTLGRASSGSERGVAVYPSAIVNKCRISDNRLVEDEFGIPTLETRPLLPPRLPVATITEIRKLIAQPLDYAELGHEFQVPEAAPATEEEMLEKRIELAEAEERAALAKQGVSNHSQAEKRVGSTESEPAVKKSYGKKSVATTAAPTSPPEQKPESGDEVTATATEHSEPAPTTSPPTKPTAEAPPVTPGKKKAVAYPTLPREEAMKIVLAGVVRKETNTGVVSAAEYTAFCAANSVDAASKLSDDKLSELAARIEQVRTLQEKITASGIPMSMVSETIEKAGARSLFELDRDSVVRFETVLQKIVADREKN